MLHIYTIRICHHTSISSIHYFHTWPIQLLVFLCHKYLCLFLHPLEDILSQKLIPTLTRRPTPGDLERDLIALLVCQDGLGIKVPPLAFFTTYHGTRLHTPQRSIQTLAWLCYGWQPANLPTNCICGALFSVEHVLLHCMCQKGLPTLRHNEVRDMTAQLLTEVSSEVCLL